MDLSCFKAYDIRGRADRELDERFAFALGRAIARVLGVKSVVSGRDARLSGPKLETALAAGLAAEGVQVSGLGLCGTEEIYHASHFFDAGVMVTGSHNPAAENGFKIVRRGAIPVGRDSGLNAIKELVGTLAGPPSAAAPPLTAALPHLREKYINWLVDYAGLATARPKRPLRVVADAGNGAAGPFLEPLAAKLPIELIIINGEPDGNFPNGVPNPLLPERREAAASAVLAHNADMGAAFDGDFDRCFFYGADGAFIEGYYMVGFLASALLHGNRGAKVIHDCRVYWNTRELVAASGGQAIMGKSGHVFMKQAMRSENAIYGGEMSAHHYYRDFAYCDSGMLTLVLAIASVMQSGLNLGEMAAARARAYPCSGEINFAHPEPAAAVRKALDFYKARACHVDTLDGINLEFPQWRFNLRPSNTEPLLRLNVESRGDAALMREKTAEISRMLQY